MLDSEDANRLPFILWDSGTYPHKTGDEVGIKRGWVTWHEGVEAEDFWNWVVAVEEAYWKAWELSDAG